MFIIDLPTFFSSSFSFVVILEKIANDGVSPRPTGNLPMPNGPFRKQIDKHLTILFFKSVFA